MARRVASRRFTPPPWWRARVPAGHVVIVDQVAALARVDELVAAQDWRDCRRSAWTLALRTLVGGMAWDGSGLVGGVTLDVIAERAGLSRRSVTSVLAWARAVELLVVVEEGASAEACGTPHGRCPTYAILTPKINLPPSPRSGEQETPCRSRDDRLRQTPRWPTHDQATTKDARTAATATLLARTGLTGRVPAWKAGAVLAAWWAAGWSVAGLLHALDHHPDRPDQSRGDAVAGARDPLAVIGHRLAPWRGRTAELPPTVRGVDPAERQAAAADLARRVEAAEHAPAREHVVTASPEARAAAMAAVRRRPTTSDTVRRHGFPREHRSRRLS